MGSFSIKTINHTNMVKNRFFVVFFAINLNTNKIIESYRLKFFSIIQSIKHKKNRM